MLKKGFFGRFFQKFACCAENLAKTASFNCFRRAQKINLVDLKKKKKVDKIFIEKILESPLKTAMMKNLWICFLSFEFLDALELFFIFFFILDIIRYTSPIFTNVVPMERPPLRLNA